MPIIKYVSFDKTGHLIVLISGQCPNCCAKHIRNVCNLRYCNEVINPILSSNFNNFSHSSPLLTHDPNIVSIVTKLGYQVKYPVEVNKKIYFNKQERLMLDLHPDIDTYCKMLSFKKKTIKKPFNPDQPVSMNQVVTK